MTEDEARAHPFPHSREDAKSAQKAPDTPQTRTPAYKLAFADMDFLLREEMRAIRVQLELLKAQMILDGWTSEPRRSFARVSIASSSRTLFGLRPSFRPS